MDLFKNTSAICKAAWTTPLPHEAEAPRRRIIHLRGLSSATPLKLERLGLRLGQGYFKCGSDPQTDWVSDLRLFTGDGRRWEVAYELRDVPMPTGQEVGETRWFDLGGIEAPAVLVELRRCAVDNWWPSWNIAQEGVVLEGSQTAPDETDPATHRPEGTLRLETCDLADLPAGVSAARLGGEVRFRTPYMEVGFRLRNTGFSYLALDDEGQARTHQNLLQFGNLFHFHHPLRGMMTHGMRLRPILAAVSETGLEGSTVVRGNTVTYEVHSRELGQSYHLYWEVLPDRLLLSASRTSEAPLRAWESSAWRMACDSRITPTVTLGKITHQGETGLLALPIVLHAPGYGSLTVSVQGRASGNAQGLASGNTTANDPENAPDRALWRADSARPIFTTTNELKIGEVPQPEGDYLLLPGSHSAEVEWIVESPQLAPARLDAPPEVERMLRRCAVTGLTFRPDTATFSNNGNSMHAVICADGWSAIATRLGEVVPGLRAVDLLRVTLERWLDGGQGYGSGWSSHSRHLFEDEYIMSGTAALLGLADYLQAAGDPAWLKDYAPAIRLELERMRARDLDGDGLVESKHRLGNRGQNQWSTCWFDVISFGWKDAFSNSLLYPALRRLAVALPRLGQPALAEGLAEWAGQLKASFLPAFLNPQTGWLGGWRSQDGELHDHGFLFVNGAAVTAGLVGESLGGEIMRKLWDELDRSGFDDFRLGLPGNLWKIPDTEMGVIQQGLPLGSYQNGGVTHSQARHFVSALYKVGMTEQADRVLTGLAASLGDATAFGGCGSGVDWRTWDGSPSGYEGLLSDQFGVLAPAIERFRR